MALTAALKAQIAAWYKALQEQIPDFIPRAPQRQMIADVAKTLAGEEGRHLAIEAPTGVGKTLSYLIPGIAIAREEQKTLVVSTANVALQDQIYSKDLPLLKKIIPDLKFTAAFGRGRYVCPRNLTALASTEPTQQDLLAFLDDELTPNNQEEQKRCAKLKGDLDTYKWDGLRDHTDIAIDDDLWRRLSTDKASCLNRNCYYYRECPFFVARREIQEAEVVVANHALVMAAMESEAVLPDPKNLLLVLDEGHHLPDVALDSPFNHCEQGKIVIPRMRVEPSIDNEEQHIAEMAAFFREQVESKKHLGMLVLFASGRAMQRFLDYVTDLRLMLLVQGDQPRYRLVELHRKRVANGERSVLVGLQSFAEGLDLKGALLSQVHIHKIAFPPIDSPVVITEGEWLKSLNRYPFEVQSLPSASFNLIQQVGRLIRSHGCWGEVVIYDKRLLTKNYGKRLLDALPVFPIEQPEVPEGIVKKKEKTKSPRRRRR
ncbi:DEAD/DEAH box helicase [Escherichia coli]|nr:DEAD/DEAH box helicase [Escherichia coli]